MRSHALRLDIEGLRAVAILSGTGLPCGFAAPRRVRPESTYSSSFLEFLITGLLLREHDANGD